jgi:hypothetical protein
LFGVAHIAALGIGCLRILHVPLQVLQGEECSLPLIGAPLIADDLDRDAIGPEVHTTRVVLVEELK